VRDEGAKVLREFTSMETSNPFGLTGHTWTKDYVWRDGLLLASIAIPAGLSTPTTYDYHLDHFGTPTMITTDNGMVVSNHTYYPFGSEMSQPQENPAEAMKFTGHERDIAAGDNHSVDYMHARFTTRIWVDSWSWTEDIRIPLSCSPGFDIPMHVITQLVTLIPTVGTSTYAPIWSQLHSTVLCTAQHSVPNSINSKQIIELRWYYYQNSQQNPALAPTPFKRHSLLIAMA
jgi:hypothetical protein